MSRSLFGVVVMPQEYRKIGFGYVSVFSIWDGLTVNTVHASVS